MTIVRGSLAAYLRVPGVCKLKPRDGALHSRLRGGSSGDLSLVRQTAFNRPGDDGRCARRREPGDRARLTVGGGQLSQAIWVVMGILDFLIVWKLILRRSLQAFHYTFLIVLFVSFFVLATLVATERLHPLGLLVRWYQHLSRRAGEPSLTGRIDPER